MDDFLNVSASLLPVGWFWHQYFDGSGQLVSPDGISYFQYDLSTREFRNPAYKGNNWVFMPGYPFDVFKTWCEEWVLNNLV